jgi:hypothetical protein
MLYSLSELTVHNIINGYYNNYPEPVIHVDLFLLQNTILFL